MAIKKQSDGRYQVDFYVGGRKGKRYKRTFNSITECEEFQRVTLDSVDYGHKPQKYDDVRLSDLINDWYDLHGQTLNSGKERRDKMLNACSLMNNPLASRFNAQTFTKYKNKRLNEGIKPNTLNHYLTYFSSMFTELYAHGKYPHLNPLRNVKKIKHHKASVTCFTDKEIRLLFDSLQKRNGDSYLVSLICLATGARWSEAVNLKLSDVINGQVAFRQTKSNKPRYIPISDELEALLIQRLRNGNFKDPISTYKDVFNNLGFKDIKPKGQLTHLLRHTFASSFLQGGGDIVTLQQALGHSTITMTMRYVHFTKNFLKDVAVKNPAVTVLHIGNNKVQKINENKKRG